MADDLASSPPGAGASVEETMAWYKSQYEQLEHELAEFRSSSAELEQELEKDLEAAEKKERALKQKAEGLNFEVEEWKRKYKESKSEANAAQNALEKEITTLRDTNRTLQHKLRDIEVANDDFERQARHTTSSLEDMESRYNTSIERVVMMEEEIKIGEQEREQLRIEAQRLREELSDLKIEADIFQDKIKKQEQRHLSVISTDISIPETPAFDRSPGSTASSPLVSTPPDATTAVSTKPVLNGPPSPPMSDASNSLPKPRATPAATPGSARPKKSRLPSAGSITPKPKFASSTAPRPPASRSATTSAAVRNNTPAARTPATQPFNTARAASNKLPESTSISHLRSLTAQMQRLEARVHSVRSKLPAPVLTPPRASPRSSISSVVSSGNITLRSRKRATTSTTTASTASTPTSGFGKRPTTHIDTKEACIFCLQFGRQCVFEKIREGKMERNSKCKNCEKEGRSGTRCVIVTGAEYDKYREIGRKRTRQEPAIDRSSSAKHVPRLSTGVSRLSFGPLPNRGPAVDSASEMSRPSSRSSYARPSSRGEGRSDMLPPRPVSRSGMSGSRTPLGRPLSRTSFGGSLHGSSLSYSTAELDEPVEGEYRTPSRRGTYSRYDMDASGIPAPSGIPMPGSRRQSAAGLDLSINGRRPSYGGSQLKNSSPQTVDIGETY